MIECETDSAAEGTRRWKAANMVAAFNQAAQDLAAGAAHVTIWPEGLAGHKVNVNRSTYFHFRKVWTVGK